MSNREILDLTNNLSQALDQNYNVVNMDVVISVISSLEGTTITKEQLEATRLAKYINHLRRRTNNENLARRAKSLLKKWREMVGMQHASGDSQQQIQSMSPVMNSAIVPSNIENLLMSSNLQSSQSTSPANRNNSENVGLRADYARGVAFNVASSVSSVTRGASLDAYNKRLDTSENQKITGSRATLDNCGRIQNQPISFSNLIKHLENTNCANRAHPDIDYKSFSQDPKANNHNMKTETLVIDHSSNSNSKSNIGLVTQSKLEEVPIVIDSDSGESEAKLIPHNSKASLTKSTEHNFTVFNVKVKKSKKEKKRRDRDSHNKIDGITTKNSVITLDDPSIAQISQNKKVAAVNTAENEIFSSVKEIKLHPSISNMSEILSLSNSSMSSIFPSENICLSARNRNTAVDLSFAGKFKANNVGVNSGSTTTVAGPASVNGRDGLTYISDSSNIESKQTKLLRKSLIVNENSSSSSRAFAFDMIDVVTQDNNQSNVIEELLQKNNISMQNNASDVVEDHTAGEIQRGSTDLIDITVNAPPSKVQKKRGRKKGSKGVDAIIAHETSLSQQIFGSGGKKVKTTKELFNEIQNKKLCFAPASSSGYTISSSQKCTYVTTKPLNQNLLPLTSRPTSSCSELSLHSPHTMDAYLTNATVSTGATRSSPDNISNPAEEGPDTDSDTMTSGLSHDRLKMRLLSHATSTDSNSISEFVSTSGKLTLSNILLAPKANDVDIQLKQLVEHLPVAEAPNIIEEKYLAQLVPCTCVLVEEVPKAELVDNDISKVDSVDPESENLIFGGSSDVVISVHIENESHHTESTKSVISDKTDISSLQKPKKSIFDLDFDEEDDPLHTLIAETLGAVSQKDADLTNEGNDGSNGEAGNRETCEDKTITHGQIVQLDENNTDNMVPFRMFHIVEDENCKAKQRYNIQTNKITNFHIDALHNCFIPNINGNWDDAISEIMNDKSLNYEVTDGSDVVPQYGSLINERIPKDLSKLLFRRDLRVSKMQFKNVPFLGVAKCLPTCRTQKKNLKDVNEVFKREKLNGIDTKLKIIKSNMSITNDNWPSDNRSYDMEYDINDLNGNPTALKVNVTNVSNTKNPEFAHEGAKNENAHRQKDDFTSPDLLAIVKLSDSHSSSGENELKTYNDNMAMIKSCSRRSSSCSSSSLKRTQNSINERLRNQRFLYTQQTIEQEKCDYNAGDGKSVKRRKKKRKKIRPDLQDSLNGPPNTETSRQRIKRIKIAINGDVATQRQISFIGSSNNNSTDDESLQFSNNSDKTDTENENNITQSDKLNESDYFEKESLLSFATVESFATEEGGGPNVDYGNNYDVEPIIEKSNNDEYAIVQRPMGGSSNHIVLTIKKTPNKTHSPANSLSAKQPFISSVNSILRTDLSASHTKTSRFSPAPRNSELSLSKIRTKAINLSERLMQQGNKKNKNTGRTCRRKRRQKTYEPQLDIALKHIFRDRINTLSAQSQDYFDQRKTHHKLFFPDELFVRNEKGKQSRILNCSSCDSSCVDESEYEYFSSSSVLSDTVQSRSHLKCIHNEKCDSNILTREDSSSSTSTTFSDEFESSDEINKLSKSSKDFIDGRKSECKTQPDSVDNKNELELENNGLLSSFNAVNSKHQPVVFKEGCVVEQQLLNALPYKNCDDNNKFTNNNNLNIIKYNLVNNINCTDSLRKENITDSDSVTTSLTAKESTFHNRAGHNEFQTGIRNIDINVTNESVGMHTRVQQFKEWHQVLQLQSYNNELLTVLPYVLLE